MTQEGVQDPPVLEEGQKPEPKLVPETDLNNLKSNYDKQIAGLNAQIDDLVGRLTQYETRQNADAILTEVNNAIAEIDMEAENAPQQLTGLVVQLGRALSARAQEVKTNSDWAQEQTANYLALKLQSEFGGDFETYRRQLVKDGTNAERMQIAYDKLEVQQQRAKPSGPKTPTVDEGRGAAVRADILKDLDDIDVSTPEGAAEFTKREAEFQRRIKAAAGNR